MSRYGRFHAPEPYRNLGLIHRHDGSTLHRAVHTPPLCVLDQQDLFAQGIDTSTIVPGAPKVDALGSCTANATMGHASGILEAKQFAMLLGMMGNQPTPADPYTSPIVGERGAIGFYHACSDQTGNPSQEWPPTDCGSSGTFIADEMIRLGFVKSQRIAHSAQDICSLLQGGSVLQGSPFFTAWEEPDRFGFVDGNGTESDLELAIRSGVAGGHETLLFEVESISLDATGTVIPAKTVLVARNSWGNWGDSGNYRIHLSTLAMLASYCDWRQLVA